MCGIAGIVDFTKRPVSRAQLSGMLDTIWHRGPDQEGIHHDGHIGLGIRRLKVIALNNGAQPSYSSDGRHVLVFNGEIYNHHALRRELINDGYQFNTDSDAEVIVNLYARDGERFYAQLDGMFALALYDRHEGALLLARDRAGKKPLYYHFSDDTVCFASELQALVKHPSIGRELDPVALDYYLRFRVVPSDRTIFRSVKKVPAGGSVRLKPNRADVTQNWQVDYTPQSAPRTEAEWIDELDAALNQAVAKRMTAEVPVGTMLSGGLDSSLITAIAVKQGHRALKTFAIGFHEAQFNELPYSRRLAADLGTDHHDYIITAREAFDAAHELIAHFGEPFAFPSSIASHFMYRLARQHVTVVLGGDGADELFGGYARYSLAAAFPDFPADYALPRKVDLAGASWSSGQFDVFYQALLTDGLGHDARNDLYSDSFRKQLIDAQQACPYRGELRRHADRLSAAMEYDFNHWMREAQLVKIDIASMANSLEVRVPFLDTEVVRIGSGLPGALKLRDGREKHLLHCVARRYLPDYILDRKKQELAMPLEQWIVSSMLPTITNTLLSDEALSRGHFNPDRLRAFVNTYDGSQSYALWTLYVLEKWHKQFS
ncbi:asparagine synthase (glutamine-hydrolyzing) [Burkholderia sp. LMG 21824]|uniref:asparagine synthase (glutamine-hydrolyzing) n=1 Tax=Burkholderia sp. LMG 21824 TaxID=3158172 RepID=UPI003C2F616C